MIAAVNTSETGGHLILLFIESDKDLRKGLRDYLKKHLPDYMMPKEIIKVSPFPLNANGKIDRKALLNEYLQKKVPKSTHNSVAESGLYS